MTERISLTELLSQLEESGRGGDLTLGEVLEVIGERGFGPLILIIAVIAILPTGAVPGVPTVCGLSIALITAQLVCGKRYPWLPAKLRGLSIDRARYQRVADRVMPWTRRLDRLIKPRLTWLTDGAVVRVVGLLIIALALCMPPLELLPFAAALPAGAIVIMGLGLAGRDGIVVLLGLVPAAFGVWLVAGLAMKFL